MHLRCTKKLQVNVISFIICLKFSHDGVDETLSGNFQKMHRFLGQKFIQRFPRHWKKAYDMTEQVYHTSGTYNHSVSLLSYPHAHRSITSMLLERVTFMVTEPLRAIVSYNKPRGVGWRCLSRAHRIILMVLKACYHTNWCTTTCAYSRLLMAARWLV